MRRTVLLSVLLSACALAAQDPVQWSLTIDSKSAAPGSHVQAKLQATIEPGWHLYSLSTPRPPIATTVSLADQPAVAHLAVYQPQPVVKLDPTFNVNTETFEHQATFLLDIELSKSAPAGAAELTAQVRYQTCSDTVCLPPKRKTAVASLTIDPAATAVSSFAAPAGYALFQPGAKPAPVPVRPPAPQEQDTGRFLLLAFGFGLAAIFTPCVFPMIPFTVSYFLNQNGAAKTDGLKQAAVFCLGIIVLFTGLGFATKAIAGPFGVVQLGNSPWVNAFITVVFLIFGFSLLGAYELTLPSGFLTKLSSASQGGGYAGTLLMGLTFSLTAFACVGPIVGPLLVASVQSSGLLPVLGMLCFATGLALPFFLLALFPSFLKKLPRSGGWLARVKVVLGFVIIAVALKYLSSVDQELQWNILTRARFLAAWVVLFALPGFYLLGFLKLEGIAEGEHTGVWRTLIGAAFLIFAISLVPGMFGSRLGEIDAFVPLSTETSGLSGNANANLPWMKNQYSEALARAKQEGKLVFVNFTGYACTNCHWMKANMFPRQEINEAMRQFVLLELYTDGTDEPSVKNQELENQKFATIAIPFYAILDSEGKVIASFPGITRKPEEFLAFLKTQPALNAARAPDVPERIPRPTARVAGYDQRASGPIGYLSIALAAAPAS